jgi:hypothetical protein
MAKALTIPNPCNLSIDVIEIDETGNLPSFRCDFSCKFEVLDSEFSFRSSSLWFECDIVDKFLSSLRDIYKGQRAVAELNDMSNEFVYKVSNDGVHVTAQFRRSGGESSALLKVIHASDPEFVPQHIRQIESFPKWW